MPIVTRTVESVVAAALWFANQTDLTDRSALLRRLRVLPPRAPYTIDEKGRIRARPGRREPPRAIVQCQEYLRGAFGALIDGDAPSDKRYLRHPNIWQLMAVLDGSIVPTDAAPLTPTLDVFVLVAPRLLHLPPYRGRLRQCPECQDYFLRHDGNQATCERGPCPEKHRKRVKREYMKKYRSS